MIRATLLAAALSLGQVEATEVHEWSLPVSGQAAQPGLVDDARGGLLLSWIEPTGDAHRLRYARWNGRDWSPAATAMQGKDWFVNWADVPAMLAFPDGRLAAFMLVRNGEGTYAYDVRLAQAGADGVWSEPRPVHDDGTTTEHGFASLWREDTDQLGIAWLDGRHTGGGGHGGGHHGDGGAMTLRTARFNRDGTKIDERELDARTCDCCGTASVGSADGRWLAYRDRDESEVRDIRVARRSADGHWLPDVVAHADGWVMPACPVNGPALAEGGGRVYLAWYTAPDLPRVRLAQLGQDGRARGEPVEVAEGSVLGRVALAADPTQVTLAFVEEDRRGARLWLACFSPELDERSRVAVADLPRGRGTGFPRLQLADGRAHLISTDVVAGEPRLRGWTVDCRTD